MERPDGGRCQVFRGGLQAQGYRRVLSASEAKIDQQIFDKFHFINITLVVTAVENVHAAGKNREFECLSRQMSAGNYNTSARSS